MNFNETARLYGFYENELKNKMLAFWLPRCEDREDGGFLNCFDNSGRHLVSHDKYAWSQGRFVWLFSRLAATPAPIFNRAERAEFLRLAKAGADFLMAHVLIAEGDWRCSFLMERDGTHKPVAPGQPLDMSIYADCFVVLGLGMYAAASRQQAPYLFAKNLYDSITDRLRSGDFKTLPYPLSSRFRAHGIPMILNNTARELLRAAEIFDSGRASGLKADMEGYARDILDHFVDADHVMHEVITSSGEMHPSILGQHQNPGHTIEDVWFLLDAAEICGQQAWKRKIYAVAKKALHNGWDSEYGGILHFCGVRGGQPSGDDAGVEDEAMTRQLDGWGDKLWWVHSEALYTTLRCFLETRDPEFFDWHEKVFEYVYRTFPNPDPEIREWEQIRRRDGTPEDKVVALPVKDPFHIIRNLILILEILKP